eukprot:1660487-Pleurochrysis_carterae.AAC.1
MPIVHNQCSQLKFGVQRSEPCGKADRFHICLMGERGKTFCCERTPIVTCYFTQSKFRHALQPSRTSLRSLAVLAYFYGWSFDEQLLVSTSASV